MMMLHHSNGGDDHAASQHRQPPADTVLAQSHADAGDQHKQNAAQSCHQLIPQGDTPMDKGEQAGNIIDKMDQDHKQQVSAPQHVQLPYSLLHGYPSIHSHYYTIGAGRFPVLQKKYLVSLEK